MRLSRRSPVRPALATFAVAALAMAGLAPAASLAVADEPEPAQVLDVSSMDPGVYDAPVTVGVFTVTATGDRTVEVDANDKTGANGAEFTQRLKLGGAGEADFRSVGFSTLGAATLDVYALSSSSGSDRALALHDLASGAVVEEVPAFGDPGSVIPTQTIEIPEAGEYYLTSPSSGVNIYSLELRAGEAPERRPWAEVAAPEVTGVALSGDDAAQLTVSYTGVVGLDGADHATAELLDAEGAVVDSAMSAAHGEGGTLALTPPASGDYEVRVTLDRADEEPKVSAPVAAPTFTLPLDQPT